MFGEIIFEAERCRLPVLRTLVPTPVAVAKVTAILEDSFVVRELLHGVLLDILGLGVLIVGESGIGKSECALDLIVRGHRLVADDTVEVRRRAETILIGTCPELTRHHMEIRGLGVINIQDLFGIASTRTSKRIELVVQLERWEARRDYDRLGLAEERYQILNLPLPLIRMPVAPGRNLAILVEIAARNQLLRARGHHAAKKLAEKLEHQLQLAGLDDIDESEIEDLPGHRGGALSRAARLRARASAAPGAVHRADGPVGLGQIAGDPGARGSRLLLRRQHSDDAHSDAGRSRAPRRHRARGHRGGHPREELPGRVRRRRTGSCGA